MLNGRHWCVLPFCAVLGGCATGIIYPVKISFNSTDSIDALKANAIQLQTSYTANIDKLQSSTNKNALFNIGSGFVLAASAIYGAPKDLISGLGLTTGTNAVANTTFGLQGQISIYEAGYSGLGCMLGAATKLPNLSANFKSVASSLRDVKFLSLNYSLNGTDLRKIQENARQVAVNQAAIEDGLKITEKAARTLDDAAKSEGDASWNLASNLNFLDRAVRRKLRETLASRDGVNVRDDLLKQIQVGEKDAAGARQLISQLELVDARLHADSRQNFSATLVEQTITELQDAASILEFDAALKKCVLSAGL